MGTGYVLASALSLWKCLAVPNSCRLVSGEKKDDACSCKICTTQTPTAVCTHKLQINRGQMCRRGPELCVFLAWVCEQYSASVCLYFELVLAPCRCLCWQNPSAVYRVWQIKYGHTRSYCIQFCLTLNIAADIAALVHVTVAPLSLLKAYSRVEKQNPERPQWSAGERSCCSSQILLCSQNQSEYVIYFFTGC